jgi:hypothetical protein
MLLSSSYTFFFSFSSFSSSSCACLDASFPYSMATMLCRTACLSRSYNRGFFHINFNNVNLKAAAKSLVPATLRFGGSGNDFLDYKVHSGW